MVHVASRVIVAPYANTPIELSLLSVNNSQYKTYYCSECHHPFLQRDSDTLYRINTNKDPARTFSDGAGTSLVRCGNCEQKYTVRVAVVGWVRYSSIQPIQHELQSLYITPVADKMHRYIRCLDCGHSFVSLADRISKIVDSALPLEYVSIDKVAPAEARCDYTNCRQRWSIVI